MERTARWRAAGTAGFLQEVHRRIVFPLLLACLLVTGAAAEAFTPPGEQDIAGLARKYGLDPAQVGVVLLDPATGQAITSYHAEDSFTPASTVKLVTAFMALRVLGPDHRFATKLIAAGRVSGGVLNGDLVIVGGGDPKLTMDDITDMVTRLAQAGVKRVTGRLLVDDASLPVLLRIDPTQPPQSPTNAGISALSSEFNRVTVGWSRAERSKKARPPVAWIDPASDNLRVEFAPPHKLPPNSIVPLLNADGSTTFQVSAERDTSGALAFPVPDPGLQTGELFKTVARKQGIVLPDPERGTLTTEGLVLVDHASAPLSDLVAGMLHYSNNQMAELLGLATAAKLAGPPGSLQAAAAVVQKDLARIVPAFAARDIFLANLSGLSARTRIEPAALAALLAAIARDPDGQQFIDMMAEAGLSGTMRGRLGQAGTIGRVHAKTGTMAYASSLAGYLDGADGRRLVFTIMTGDRAGRAGYDAMSGDRKPLDGATLGWLDQAKAFQDALVGRWLAGY